MELINEVIKETSIHIRRLVFKDLNGGKQDKEIYTNGEINIVIRNEEQFNMFLFLHSERSDCIETIRNAKQSLALLDAIEKNVVTTFLSIASSSVANKRERMFISQDNVDDICDNV